MSARRAITRRRALVLGLGLAAAAAGMVVSRLTPAPIQGRLRPALRDALESVLSDPESTARLGTDYLRIEPREASIDLLLRRLPIPGHTADESEAVAVADPVAALAHVGRATTVEFSHGETIVVSGWELARSEARLAGLYAALKSWG